MPKLCKTVKRLGKLTKTDPKITGGPAPFENPTDGRERKRGVTSVTEATGARLKVFKIAPHERATHVQ